MGFVERDKKKVRVRVSSNARLARFFFSTPGKILLSLVVVLAIASVSVFTYYYIHYSKLIDAKLKAGPFTTTSRIYAAPIVVGLGDTVTPDQIAAELRRGGYTESRSNPVGSYNLRPDGLEIYPGPESYFRDEPGVIHFGDGRIIGIVSLSDNTPRTEYNLEPRLITNLYNRNREKRRYVHYEDIPAVLRDAVISAEDRRFFQHSGFDPIGIMRAAWVDLRRRPERPGRFHHQPATRARHVADTCPELPRKAAEFMITLQLEQKLSKQQIFEMYSNQIDLGRRGRFTIRGFGEAAEAYFGKDIRQLTLPLKPRRWRACCAARVTTIRSVILTASSDRRNVVLALMRENDYPHGARVCVGRGSPVEALSAGANRATRPTSSTWSTTSCRAEFSDYDFQAGSYRIYTSLDLNLQRAANDAVQTGMKQVDELLHKQQGLTTEAQCALDRSRSAHWGDQGAGRRT